MLYTVTTNKEGYIMSIGHTANDSIDLDLQTMELEYLNAYQLIDNVPVLNEMRKTEIIAEKETEEHDEHIRELKQFLKDTDYITAESFEKVLALNNPVTFISDMIKILVEYNSKYADIIAQRVQARKEIEGNTETK